MVCGVVIVHGQSEKNIVDYISSNYRIPIKVFSHKNGKSSIQIDGLPDVFSNKKFNTQSDFENWIGTDLNSLNSQSFKIFTLMDLDDVSNKSVKSNYKAGSISGIGKHWAKKFIVPIYCDGNLEDVLKDIQYPYAPNNKAKKKYIEVFPVNHNDDTNDLKDIQEFKKKLLRSQLTNLDTFVQFCFDNKSDFS
ncbi:hypothetical protein [Leuconostoc mesenteroides]|uniref:hypothetical protein n=1 Tax=Leuconostoc mesenteroides TaxID=1245 RepID=UPI00123C21CD|nr:hypothetical protein [Leuconostoc mesenteroides]KAA8346856.1 hypothetical protein FE418_09115 [Leuconostoc mesenteroides]